MIWEILMFTALTSCEADAWHCKERRFNKTLGVRISQVTRHVLIFFFLSCFVFVLRYIVLFCLACCAYACIVVRCFALISGHFFCLACVVLILSCVYCIRYLTSLCALYGMTFRVHPSTSASANWGWRGMAKTPKASNLRFFWAPFSTQHSFPTRLWGLS